MNGFSEQDFGVLARVLDSLTAMVNLKNHYDVYSAVEHAFRVCLEEEAQFAKLIGDEPNSWRAGLRLLHDLELGNPCEIGQHQKLQRLVLKECDHE